MGHSHPTRLKLRPGESKAVAEVSADEDSAPEKIDALEISEGASDLDGEKDKEEAESDAASEKLSDESDETGEEAAEETGDDELSEEDLDEVEDDAGLLGVESDEKLLGTGEGYGVWIGDEEFSEDKTIIYGDEGYAEYDNSSFNLMFHDFSGDINPRWVTDCYCNSLISTDKDLTLQRN